ncbi:MAG: hypothetical protein ACP5PW_02550 [Candidatus Dormibacteria bacterium]
MTTADRRARQRGQILPLFALLLAMLLLPVAALAVDGGLILTRHAELVGEAQAAAEAGAQAVDQTALSQNGTFQLCVTADGGPDCGNGVGNVLAVVNEVMSSSAVAGINRCIRVTAIPAFLAGASGCDLAVLSPCGAGGPPLGVEVAVWAPAEMPLAGVGPLGTLRLRAEATSWLAHGIGAMENPPVLPRC